tara:strand:- start:52431 stop:53066 length:636 start_codon:yes stop_codon:yes gene_type:complete
MARIARIVVPGLPHHVTQRGNRREQVFFEEADYALYLDMLAESAARARCAIWAYCLMPNHVHFILVPSGEDGLRRTFADLQRRYPAMSMHEHEPQGIFGRDVMDRWSWMKPICFMPSAMFHSIPCGRDWSSARAHLAGGDNGVVKLAPVLERVGESFDEDAAYAPLRRAETIGRPVGDTDWLKMLEKQTGRVLMAQKRGRRPNKEIKQVSA